MTLPIDVRFTQQLKTLIADDLTRLHRELGNGSQIVPDAALSGMKCARYVGEIAGLERALKLIEHVNDKLTGKVKDTKPDGQNRQDHSPR